MRIALTSAAALAATLGLAAAPQVLAQTATPPAAAQPPAPAQYDDAQLRSFAKATVAVQAVNERYGPQVQAAAAEERQAVQQQASTEMVAQVEAAGLDVQTYNEIAARVQADPALSQRVAQHMAEVRDSAG